MHSHVKESFFNQQSDDKEVCPKVLETLDSRSWCLKIHCTTPFLLIISSSKFS